MLKSRNKLRLGIVRGMLSAHSRGYQLGFYEVTAGDYRKLFEYVDAIDAVTAEDVRRVAKKYLNSKKTVVLIVGDKKTILKGHPDHPVSLQNLTSGGLIDIPLRDPFTLEPIK